MQHLRAGQRIGPYRIVDILGRGGVGVVYRAHDERLDQLVALKMLNSAESGELPDMAEVQRFLREARTAASVTHPNVVRVLSASETGSFLLLAQELVPGGTLQQRLKQLGPLPWQQAARVGAQIARGLAAIHAAGLVHRDLKPSNVLLDEHGTPKISDFGLARKVGATSIALTKTGEMLGTAEYLAPEQADDAKAVDHRADLYALGGLLHALLTGQPPFEGSSVALITKHLTAKPRPPSALAPDVPPELDRVVLSLLEKDPAARPDSGDLVADRLEALLAPSRARAGSGGARGALVALAALVTIVGGGALGYVVAVRGGGAGPPATTEVGTATPLPPSTERPESDAAPPSDDELRRRRYPASRLLNPVAVLGGFALKTPADVLAVAITTDGRVVAVTRRGLHLFEASSGRVLRSTPVGHALSSAVALPENRLATAGERRVVWDLSGPEPVEALNLPAPASGQGQVSASADGRSLLYRARGEDVRVFDASSGARTATVAGTKASTCAAVAPDGRTAFVGGPGAQVSIIDLSGAAPPRRVPVAKAATALAVAPDGRRLLVGDGSGAVTLLDVATGAAVGPSVALPFKVSSITLSPGGERAVVTCDDGTNPTSSSPCKDPLGHVLLVGADGLTVAAALMGHTAPVRGAAFTADGARVFTGSLDRTLRAFDVATSTAALQPVGHAGWVVQVVCSRDGTSLATGGLDCTVRLWDRTTREELDVQRLPWGAFHVAFSPEGKRLLAATLDGLVVVWDVTPERKLRERTRGRLLRGEKYLLGVAFYGEDRVLTASGPARLWALEELAAEPITLPLSMAGRTGLLSYGACSCTPWGDGQVLIGTDAQAIARIDLRESVPQAPPPIPLGDARVDTPSSARRMIGALSANYAADLVAGMLSSGRVGFLNVRTGAVVMARGEQGLNMRGVALDPLRGRVAASTSDDSTLKLWDVETGAELDSLSVQPPLGDAPAGVTFSPDGERLFVGTFGGVVLEVEVQR